MGGCPKTGKADRLICMGLILVTLAICAQTTEFDFINRKTGRLARAVTLLKKALALDPSNDQPKKYLEKVQAAMDTRNWRGIPCL